MVAYIDDFKLIMLIALALLPLLLLLLLLLREARRRPSILRLQRPTTSRTYSGRSRRDLPPASGTITGRGIHTMDADCLASSLVTCRRTYGHNTATFVAKLDRHRFEFASAYTATRAQDAAVQIGSICPTPRKAWCRSRLCEAIWFLVSAPRPRKSGSHQTPCW